MCNREVQVKLRGSRQTGVWIYLRTGDIRVYVCVLVLGTQARIPGMISIYFTSELRHHPGDCLDHSGILSPLLSIEKHPISLTPGPVTDYLVREPGLV